MAGSTRTELASNSLESSSFAATYPNGQRGAYSASSLERSGSFRENLENRVMVSGPGSSRNTTTPLEIPSLPQYLTLEPFSMGEQKYPRLGELRRILGVTVEDHSFGSQAKPLPTISSEDLKRFRASLLESSTRASRDRAKLLHESILKLDKYRNILSRKRQKSDVSTDKLGSSSLLKMGSQAHQNPAELSSQRLEDRTKNMVPNKRARSSMADVRLEGRGNAPTRQGLAVDKEKSLHFDKDKTMLRACNGATVMSEDKIRGLPPGGEGWEKKLKRKRSVGTAISRLSDGDREIKLAMQQRPNNESRPRSNDNHGLRPGLSCGIVGSNKADGSSQQSGASSRVIPKTDMDSGPLPIDRRERSSGLSKGNNKLNVREDAQGGSQSPLPKGKASRSPRTASGVVTSTPSNFPRSSGGIDGWEQAPCSNKVQPLSGPTNRKRPMPIGSTSPPVAQWVGQRPQKISRTRRANVVSPVSNLDDAQNFCEGFTPPDIGLRCTPVESSGLLISGGIANNSQQAKLKSDTLFSPSGLSESEESGAIENKFKENGTDNSEIEDRSMNAIPKATSSVLPTKKNKVPLKEENGDGVRRQGRSGRGGLHYKACLPLTKEKLEIGDTTKPLKIGKPGSDKNESRIGRPLSRKASDRKAYTRPGQIAPNGSSDLTGESDDDWEELLLAANAAHTASYDACLGSFWKKVEQFFTFVTSEDINFVKHQINFVEELDSSVFDIADADHRIMDELPSQLLPSAHSSLSIEQSKRNVLGPDKPVAGLASADDSQLIKVESRNVETNKWFEKMVPLSQRLLSAFIAEDENEFFDRSIPQGDMFVQFPTECFPAINHAKNDHEAQVMKPDFQFDLDFENLKNHPVDKVLCNGFTASSNSRSSLQHFINGDDLSAENNSIVHSTSGILPETFPANPNQLEALCTSFSGTSPYECQFDHISLDDKILMELHSIGLYPDIVPELDEGEDGEIDKAILQLKMQLYQQLKQKKTQLHKLEQAIQDAKLVEERNLEQLAINKLVEMAYRRLLGGRSGSSHKSGASKVSKILALAFAKRTLARCQKFEETGRSCFSEPALQDVIFSASVQSSDAKYADGVTSGVTANVSVESHIPQLGTRVSGSPPKGTTTAITDRHGIGQKLDGGLLHPYQGLIQMPEQTLVENDPISNRVKKREVLLDDVVTAASRGTSTLSHTLPGGAKWKRLDRDRDQSKDVATRNSTSKAGRPSLSNGRGERKTKAKPKQKIAQLSTSGNGLGKVSEAANYTTPSARESCETTSSSGMKINQETEIQSAPNVQDSSKDVDSIFTNLPLPGIDSIDEIDVAEGLGGQGQDIGSWLNVDEETLLDHDLVGLEIPMDDLSDLKFSF
ncbi:uncharacterized protein [Typha latifolia]|uniref:uncharacterized protein isoform X1 n=1 Tax=Typha latifolia TaxID=4733 RepID=UPI003C2F795E